MSQKFSGDSEGRRGTTTKKKTTKTKPKKSGGTKQSQFGSTQHEVISTNAVTASASCFRRRLKKGNKATAAKATGWRQTPAWQQGSCESRLDLENWTEIRGSTQGGGWGGVGVGITAAAAAVPFDAPQNKQGSKVGAEGRTLNSAAAMAWLQCTRLPAQPLVMSQRAV